MVKLAILYYSRSGNVHDLAAAATAAAEKAGAEPRLLKFPELPNPMVVDQKAYAELAEATKDVPEVTTDDLVWADAIMIGTPVHFGGPAPEIMHFWDHTAPTAVPGHLMNTVASVFASGSTSHAGIQTAMLSLYNALAHWGCLIAPTGASIRLQTSDHNGSPYGTSSISRHRSRHVHEDNLKLIEFQTVRLVETTRALKIGLEQTESSIEYITLEEVGEIFPEVDLP